MCMLALGCGVFDMFRYPLGALGRVGMHSLTATFYALLPILFHSSIHQAVAATAIDAFIVPLASYQTRSSKRHPRVISSFYPPQDGDYSQTDYFLFNILRSDCQSSTRRDQNYQSYLINTTSDSATTIISDRCYPTRKTSLCRQSTFSSRILPCAPSFLINGIAKGREFVIYNIITYDAALLLGPKHDHVAIRTLTRLASFSYQNNQVNYILHPKATTASISFPPTLQPEEILIPNQRCLAHWWMGKATRDRSRSHC